MEEIAAKMRMVAPVGDASKLAARPPRSRATTSGIANALTEFRFARNLAS